MDDIDRPRSRIIRFFYEMAKRINTNLTVRTAIFLIVALLVVTSAVLDVVKSRFFLESNFKTPMTGKFVSAHRLVLGRESEGKQRNCGKNNSSSTRNFTILWTEIKEVP